MPTFITSAVWGGTSREVTQPWGPTTLTLEPPYQGGHWHCGIDVGLAPGTPLFAARAGKVTHRTSGVLGITSSSDQTDYYVHGTASVLLGAIVQRGQQLGWSGAVIPGGGALTGPHLHFEIQPAGGILNRPTGLNPLPVLAPTQSAGSGTEVPDMTPEEHDALMAIRNGNAIRNAVSIDQIQARIDQAVGVITAAIKAIPTGPGGDYAEVLAAVAHVQEIVDKIDRGE